MNSEIRRVAYYIEKHLDDELDIEKLASVAGYSSYHFCRMFKVNTGESAISYATRLKLERAAKEMMLEDKSMIEIALDAGYKTPTGFLKAFKVRFGITPTDYKQGTQVHLNKYRRINMNTPTIVNRDKVDVVFTRETGNYEKSSEIAWERLSKQMNSLNEQFKKREPQSAMNLGIDNTEAIGICYDDPQVTNEENIRYDAALVWEKEDVAELSRNYGFESKSVAGGRYATVDYIGDANGEEAWYGLYAWIEKNDYKLRDEPAFEKYLNATTEVDKSKIHTQVYVPIV